MTIEAVIFDLDGTLADFNLDYKSVRAEVKSFLLNREVPTSILSTKESIFQMLDKTRIFLKNQDKPEKAVEEISQEALAIAEEYEVEASRKTSLLPSVIETLKILKKKRIENWPIHYQQPKINRAYLRKVWNCRFFRRHRSKRQRETC